jgi:peroxiredoxin
MFKLHNGEVAPDFSLTDVNGNAWRLSDHRGKMVILHFCRGEYCPTTRSEFTYWDSFSHIFKMMNCELVYLVNGGRENHKQWAQDAVGEMYGIYGVNHNDTKRDDYPNYVAPSVYLLDKDGEICCFWLLSGPRGRPSPEGLLGILCYAQTNGWKY